MRTDRTSDDVEFRPPVSEKELKSFERFLDDDLTENEERESLAQSNENADSSSSVAGDINALRATHAVVDILVSKLSGTMLRREELEILLSHQKETHTMMQSMNAKLLSFNDFSATQYAAMAPEFARYSKLVRDMRADLDYIFRTLRSMRERIQSKQNRDSQTEKEEATDSASGEVRVDTT